MAGGRAGFQTLLGGFATKREKEAARQTEGKGGAFPRSRLHFAGVLEMMPSRLMCFVLGWMPARRQLSLGEAKEHTHTYARALQTWLVGTNEILKIGFRRPPPCSGSESLEKAHQLRLRQFEWKRCL
jgi:hypothetical protein